MSRQSPAQHPSRKLAFVVPALHDSAAQHEDTVQLLAFAAATIEQALGEGAQVEATVIAAAGGTAGWSRCAPLFSARALERVSVEALGEPITPNLALPGHKLAYNAFEQLKGRGFDEIHCLDRGGLLFYPTQARRLGLHFLSTALAVHVVGGTLFRAEAEDALVDSLNALMDDVLERGAVERADAVFVHDRRAWQWYAGKVAPAAGQQLHDLAWPAVPAQPEPAAAEPAGPLNLIFYGPLGADGGLPIFCDAVGRALPQLGRPAEVVFIGEPQAIGGTDAVSYIRLRSAKWKAPITIKRDLALADELALIGELGGVLVVSTARRESLRARLAAGLGLPVVQIERMPGGPDDQPGLPAVPGQIAAAILAAAVRPAHTGRPAPALPALWREGRPALPGLAGVPAAEPLRMPGDDQPRVSVCVTHFSRPQKLRVALESLKRQTYQNFEVIVVDDGSPDPAVQRELAAIREEIAPLGWRLLSQENRYLGAARNFGARHASGDYLIFMDDDNAAKPHEISTFVAVAQRTGAQIVTTFYDGFEADEDLEAPTPAVRFTPFGGDATLGVLTNSFGDANALYERRAFAQVGGFTEDYGITHEDWEFFCRAALAGLKMACVPEPLFWYRVDPNGMYRNELTLLHKSANLRRHIRPFLQKLPHDQARLVQLALGLNTELPLVTVGKETRQAAPPALQRHHDALPYARVAVITRTKDRPILLRRAIRGLLAQTFRDWLLVIVNDGGSPETVELVVEEFADELAGRALVVHHPVSMGMQTAANAGLTSCDSDFIIIHDDDDSLEPTFLARTVSHLDACGWDPRSGGVITWARVIVEELGGDGSITRHSDFIFSQIRQLSLVDLAIENRFPPISFLFRRAALEVVGPFREQHGPLGDWDFHLRVLHQFHIDVIAEPLANYHHRTQTTGGVYGNSVHAQNDVHRRKRAELINSAVRGEEAGREGVGLSQLLAFGELHHSLQADQQREFQRLHDYIWTLEQKLTHIAGQLDGQPAAKATKAVVAAAAPRNLALNGDFRLWPGPGKVSVAPGEAFRFAELCPGFVICHDGRGGAYGAEQRKWDEDGERLPFGTTYLHLRHEAPAQGGSFFVLELQIPRVLELSGKQVTVSGVGRMRAVQDWAWVGGRFRLADGRELQWPYLPIGLNPTLQRWSCTLRAPAVHPAEIRGGDSARIVIMLPHDQPFELDLTQIQVEVGAAPSAFTFNGELPLRQRLALLWRRLRARLLPGAARGAAAGALTNSQVSA